MKIHAYQIPPEHQESPLFWDESAFEGIELYGNRHYTERTSDLFRNIPAIIDALDYELQQLQLGEKPHEDFALILEAYTGRDDYTRSERKKWIDIIRRWTTTNEEAGVFLDVLELIRKKEYARATLRGCCQGDWQNIIYPAEYGAEWLRAFEIEYFNLGTEWTIHENDENEFSMYCTTDDPRAEIAEAVNSDPKDIILYEFDGWERTPKYKEVQA